MRRIVLLVSALLLCASAAARADFHDPSQACANVPGYAFVGLGYLDGYLWFHGEVYCNGATSVEITSLTLTSVVPPGPAVSGSTTSCGPCGESQVEASGLANDSLGVYRVDMQFTATGPGGTFTPSRSGTYLVTMSPIDPLRVLDG
jgi:hypothetical protein